MCRARERSIRRASVANKGGTECGEPNHASSQEIGPKAMSLGTFYIIAHNRRTISGGRANALMAGAGTKGQRGRAVPELVTARHKPRHRAEEIISSPLLTVFARKAEHHPWWRDRFAHFVNGQHVYFVLLVNGLILYR